MGEFLSSYGLWILVVAVLAGMHWFGRACSASHRFRDDARDGEAGGESAAQRRKEEIP